jgi:hypothetical protein
MKKCKATLCKWAESGRHVSGWWPNTMETEDGARPRWRWRQWGIPASRHRRWVGNRCCGRAAVWWTGLRQKRGRRGAHRSCPQRRLRLMGNRRQKHELGVEGAGDWVGEVRGAASELPLRLTGGPSGFDIFLKLSKPAQTWKLKMDALRCCKSSQNLHATRLGHYEQPSQLCRHPNLNRCRVKFLEQIHNLNFCGFLKGFNPSGKNLINSPKILLDMDFIKVNLVGITCMEEKGLPSKCQTVWFEKK